MKNALLLLISLLSISCNKKLSQTFVATDIDNFWNAYEHIEQTKDTLLQAKYLQNLYFDKGTVGLKDIVEVRRYSTKEYLNAINNYKKFWQSIKPNTLKAKTYQKDIEKDIQKLKRLYPPLKPASIYFTIGAFRTNGTTKGKNILIGSELAMADQNTVIDELPEWRKPFFKTYKPLENLALLCTHEYIHTQQKTIVENLLSMCLYEGIAEFISCKATGKPSNSPAIEFGKTNKEKVVAKFVEDLYLMDNNYNWLWGENRNELKVRDLGYYIGYEISERYYNQATDKKKAIKELIELDYTDEKEVERIVDASKLLPKTIIELYNDYENKRPTVEKIIEFENGSQTVNPSIKTITLNFSEVLNGYNTGLDFGPLGTEHYPNVKNETRKWGSDNRSYSFEIDLKPNKRYQIIISNFMRADGIRLKPFLIDFKTSE